MKEPIAELLELEGLNVDRVEKNADSITLHVQLKQRPCCPSCGGNIVAKNGPYKRTFQDLPLGRKQTFVSFSDHEYRCLNDGCEARIFVPQIPIVPKKGRMTERLENAIADDAFGKNTFLVVAERYFTSEETVRRVFMKRLKFYEENVQYKPVVHLGIDEAHISGVPRLVLVNTTSSPARLIDILPNNTKATVVKCLTNIYSPDTIKTVTMDMSAGYREAVIECLPNAKVIVDHFHVTMHLIEAMNEVRSAYYEKIKQDVAGIKDRAEREKADERLKQLGMNHYWFKTNFEDLSPKSARRLAALIAAYPEFGTILSLKERFREVYDSETRGIAEERYEAWKATIPLDDLYAPFRKFTNTVERWHKWIFNYFDEPIGSRHSNGPIEAINGSIKRVMRNGCGYKFEVLRGKLLYGDIEAASKVSATTALTEFMLGSKDAHVLGLMHQVLHSMVQKGCDTLKVCLTEPYGSEFRTFLITNDNIRTMALRCAQDIDDTGETLLFSRSIPVNELDKELYLCMVSSMESPPG